MEGSQDVNLDLLVGLGIAGMLILAIGIVLFIIIYERKMFHNKLRMSQMEKEYQKKLLRSSLLSQEKERDRIARDLHDDVGGILSAMNLNLQLIDKFGNSPEKIKEGLEQTSEMLEEAIKSVRRISQDLLPVTLDKFGISSAIKELCKRANHPDILDVTFMEEGTPFRFEKAKEKEFYRIVQELLNNALKHSNAKRIEIQLHWEPREIRLVVKDDGQGFEIKSNGKHIKDQSLGLGNIETRANVLNADLNIISGKGKGVKINVSLTVDERLSPG